MRIVETENARFFENGEISGNTIPRNVVVDEISVELPLPLLHNDLIVPTVVEPLNLSD